MAPESTAETGVADPTLSVVVGSVECERSIEACLASIRESTAGLRREILVADASVDRSADLAARVEGVRVTRHPSGTLVPELWGHAIRRSVGRYVAVTTGHCTVPHRWATSLIGALEDGAGGAGAGLRPNPGIGATDRAVFDLRYSAFLELTSGPARDVPDVPGDNAAYHGDDLRSFLAGRDRRGFWEVEYHEDLRARGRPIRAVPEATAGFGPAFPFGTILRHRFVHGRHHGAWRIGAGGQPRWRVVLPAPLVPLVLLGRTARRELDHGGRDRSWLKGVVPFLALSGAWAAGEAVGALGRPAGEEGT